ncbi:MAG: FAD-dependent oxidoreductase [Pseudomonadota bacterium]
MAEHVIVVGAGIVGAATAIWLRRAGHRVTLVDRLGPGEGTSYGNAGVLASCSMVPVTGPGLIKKAPKMALDRNQPLFLKWGYVPRLMPWLIKYLSHANAADTRRIAEGLAGIVADSLEEHEALAQGTPAARYVTPSDYTFAYRDRAAYEGDAFGWSLRRAHGFKWREIEGTEAVFEYDPLLGPEVNFLAALDRHGHIKDPGAYVKALAEHAISEGAQFVKGDVSDLVRAGGAVTGVRVAGETLAADKVVIATGVWSGPLAKALGVNVPLESERGYHMELFEPSQMPRHPLMVAAGKFVATPMEGRIRLAGIVEFGGLEAGPSEAPFRLLERSIRAAMPGLTWHETSRWQGHRPAPSDSLPLIGEVPGLKGAFMGFGHHHIGLTAGPRTGRLLAQMMAGQKPNIDMSPFAPARFASGHNAPQKLEKTG